MMRTINPFIPRKGAAGPGLTRLAPESMNER